MESSILGLASFTSISVIALFCLRKNWRRRVDVMEHNSRLTRILGVSYHGLIWLLACFSLMLFLIVFRLQSTGLDPLTNVLLAVSGILAAASFPLVGAIVAHLKSSGKGENNSFYRQLATMELFLIAPFAIGLIGLSIWYVCSQVTNP